MEEKKTIWCISKYASPPRYGVGARLFYVAREFSRMGVDTLLISSDSNHLAEYPVATKTYNNEQYEDLNHIWIKTKKYNKSASLKRFISWFDFELKLFRLPKKKLKKPNVVIISSLSIFTIVFGIYLKYKYKCKLVFEIRDIYPLTLTEEFGVSKHNPMILLLGLIEKYGYKHSDLIVGTMPNLKKHVIGCIKEDKPVFYSPLGIHERWFNNFPEANTEIDNLFPSGNEFIVGYAGSMGNSNALNYFIEAIKEMSQKNDVFFVLVGEGDLKRDFIDTLTEFNNVRIGPKIKQDEIPYFLSKCDLLYLSTHDSKIWEYGQSMNKLIDYMMSGKPIIASYSGYPSMLNEANSGIFIPTGDIESIVNAINKFKDMDPGERNDFGLRGKNWVKENHTYESIALNYYNRIMKMFEETE